MTWVRIDDQFPEHPKIAAAGPLAGWLHLCGLCYCNRNLTDGFIPRSVAHRLTSYEHIGLETGGDGSTFSTGDDVDCEWMAQVLCDHGIWKQTANGYLIHDYLEYQPSRQQIEAQKRLKQAAGRAGGQASAKARAQAKGKHPPKQKASKSQPHPVPNKNNPILPSNVVEVPAANIDFSTPSPTTSPHRWQTPLDLERIGNFMEGGKD